MRVYNGTVKPVKLKTRPHSYPHSYLDQKYGLDGVISRGKQAFLYALIKVHDEIR